MFRKQINPKELEIEIENIVKRNRMNYLDAILHYCELNGIDESVIGSQLTNNIKGKLRVDAESLNLLKKSSKLPI